MAGNALSQEALESLYATGHRLLMQERHANAASVFRIMLQLAPSDERSWLALGECHQHFGDDDIALELYSAGVLAAPSAVRCAVACFRLLYDRDRQHDADRAFSEAVAMAEAQDDGELLKLVNEERRMRP